MSEINKLTRSTLKSVVLEQKELWRHKELGVLRDQMPILLQKVKTKQVVVITGIRRCGKSTLLRQYAESVGLGKTHYFNFEDERLAGFAQRDFNLLLEVLIEVSGEQRILLFDEIQSIKGWELFVRRLHDEGYALVVTGSNASMLSQELGTKLTGRHVNLTLYPFSFGEYISLKHPKQQSLNPLLTAQRGKLLKMFTGYLKDGGMPAYLKVPDHDILTGVYEDILYRDIAQRYQIDNMSAFRELAMYLLSHAGKPLVFNKLKQYFNLGSVNTVSKYVGYLENAYLLFVINQFSGSLKQQAINPKKIYGICNGLLGAVSFSLGDQASQRLENVVFLYLTQHFGRVFYYRTPQNWEIDFVVRDARQRALPIQVCTTLKDPQVRERELRALQKGMAELKVKRGFVLTESETEDVVAGAQKIYVRPVFELLLGKMDWVNLP